MSCGSLGALLVVGLVIWAVWKALNPPHEAVTSWEDEGGPQSWDQSGAQVELKGNANWQWANIRLPLPFEMPPGLIVGVRPNPRIAIEDGARDERAFYAIADGLGKTATTLAHLLERPGPHLVVCPLSVVRNWRAEAERFTPKLDVRVHHGPDRHRGASVLCLGMFTVRPDQVFVAGCDVAAAGVAHGAISEIFNKSWHLL